MAGTIVVGVDGSETAARAARRAAELAHALGHRLHVLSAYGKLEVERYSSGSEQFVFDTLTEAEQTAEKTVSTIIADFPGVSVTIEGAEGKPGDALVEAAKRLDAQLIVVGNKRVQGISRVLGSVARDVATHAACDVYIVYTHPH